MDEKLATKIREALTHTDDVVAALANALYGTTSPMTVRDARNNRSLPTAGRGRQCRARLSGRERSGSVISAIGSVKAFLADAGSKITSLAFSASAVIFGSSSFQLPH